MTEARPWLLKQLVMAKGDVLVGTQARPEGLLKKEASNGFEIKVKVSTEGWEYDKLNLMFNFNFSQKANLYKIGFQS